MNFLKENCKITKEKVYMEGDPKTLPVLCFWTTFFDAYYKPQFYLDLKSWLFQKETSSAVHSFCIPAQSLDYKKDTSLVSVL
jgi:hypothetical protein